MELFASWNETTRKWEEDEQAHHEGENAVRTIHEDADTEFRMGVTDGQ